MDPSIKDRRAALNSYENRGVERGRKQVIKVIDETLNSLGLEHYSSKNKKLEQEIAKVRAVVFNALVLKGYVKETDKRVKLYNEALVGKKGRFGRRTRNEKVGIKNVKAG